MTMTRRTFLAGSAAGLAGAAAANELAAAKGEGAPRKIRISARHFGSRLDAAKEAGLAGVEVGVGGPEDKLRIADKAYRKEISRQMKATGLKVSSLSMDLLNGHPVGMTERDEAWLVQTIEAAKDLGAAGILVPFFGKANLLKGKKLKPDAARALVARMKQVAPHAEKAGVMLGLENTCSAKQNIQILERIGSKAVGCYYDIGNSTYAGYDAPAEIRMLKDWLCLIHFKDGGHYLGEGKVKMAPVAEALRAIKYAGWIVLETACPSKNAVADCKRNGEFIRKLMAPTA
jgi:L-ribulose-5-phosphate 3-epimerase